MIVPPGMTTDDATTKFDNVEEVTPYELYALAN